MGGNTLAVTRASNGYRRHHVGVLFEVTRETDQRYYGNVVVVGGVNRFSWDCCVSGGRHGEDAYVDKRDILAIGDHVTQEFYVQLIQVDNSFAEAAAKLEKKHREEAIELHNRHTRAINKILADAGAPAQTPKE